MLNWDFQTEIVPMCAQLSEEDLPTLKALLQRLTYEGAIPTKPGVSMERMNEVTNRWSKKKVCEVLRKHYLSQAVPSHQVDQVHDQLFPPVAGAAAGAAAAPAAAPVLPQALVKKRKAPARSRQADMQGAPAKSKTKRMRVQQPFMANIGGFFQVDGRDDEEYVVVTVPYPDESTFRRDSEDGYEMSFPYFEQYAQEHPGWTFTGHDLTYDS
jgi:hypothetical protein